MKISSDEQAEDSRIKNQAMNKLMMDGFFLFFHALVTFSLRCVILCDVRNKKNDTIISSKVCFVNI